MKLRMREEFFNTWNTIIKGSVPTVQSHVSTDRPEVTASISLEHNDFDNCSAIEYRLEGTRTDILLLVRDLLLCLRSNSEDVELLKRTPLEISDEPDQQSPADMWRDRVDTALAYLNLREAIPE